MCGIGMILHQFILRPIAQSVGRQVLGPVFVGVATIALSMLLEGAATLFFGAFPRGMNSPFKGVVAIGKAGVSYQQIFVVLFTIVLFALMYLVLNKTRAGLATRATAQDRHTASLYGIKVSRIGLLVMGIGCSLAALAGGVVTPLFSIDPFIGSQALFMTVLAIVIGGLGSLMGAILGGLILGFLGSIVSYYITYFYEITLFGLVVLVLLVRPQGLFGEAETGQASGFSGAKPAHEPGHSGPRETYPHGRHWFGGGHILRAGPDHQQLYPVPLYFGGGLVHSDHGLWAHPADRSIQPGAGGYYGAGRLYLRHLRVSSGTFFLDKLSAGRYRSGTHLFTGRIGCAQNRRHLLRGHHFLSGRDHPDSGHAMGFLNRRISGNCASCLRLLSPSSEQPGIL